MICDHQIWYIDLGQLEKIQIPFIILSAILYTIGLHSDAAVCSPMHFDAVLCGPMHSDEFRCSPMQFDADRCSLNSY